MKLMTPKVPKMTVTPSSKTARTHSQMRNPIGDRFFKKPATLIARAEPG